MRPAAVAYWHNVYAALPFDQRTLIDQAFSAARDVLNKANDLPGSDAETFVLPFNDDAEVLIAGLTLYFHAHDRGARGAAP